MTRSTFRFVSLLASTFSAVLCVPQFSSPASDGIQTGQDSPPSTSGNLAFLPGTSDQSYINTVALQGNGAGTIPPIDSTLGGAGLSGAGTIPATDDILVGAGLPGAGTIPSTGSTLTGAGLSVDENLFLDDQNANYDILDPTLPAANTLLSQAVRKAPARGTSRDDAPEITCAEGTELACCFQQKGKKGVTRLVCDWIYKISEVAKCLYKACCSAAGDKPDKYCPNLPHQQVQQLWDQLGNVVRPIIESPGGGGAPVGAGAAGFGGAASNY